MYWLFSISFFVVLFFHYELYGYSFLDIFGYERTNCKQLIAGFLSLFFVIFCVGFPCQLTFQSFKLYFIIQIVVFLIIDFMLIWRYREKILSFIENKNYLNFSFYDFICNNWILIVFVILFTAFSMANQLPIYGMNYDDMYYIGKIESLAHAEHLFDTDYFNGRVYNTLKYDITRQVNTYELSYAFFSSLFHIKTTFFCRATMVVHNYTLFSIICKELASNFVKKENSQYVLIPFFVFLLPFGYLQSAYPFPFKIQSFDLWQFQTASFYGGSIVRMDALFIVYLFVRPLLDRIEMKKVIALIVISIVLLSFSTVYAQLIVLLFIALLTCKFVLLIQKYHAEGNRKKELLSIAGLIFVGIFLLFTKIMDNTPLLNYDQCEEIIQKYISYVQYWFDKDLILCFGTFAVILVLMFSKKRDLKILSLLCLEMILLLNPWIFKELLVLSSFKYFFVILRCVATVQYLVLIIVMCSVISLFENKKFIAFFYNFFSIVIITSILIVFKINRSAFVNFTYLGSGISEDGWSFSRIFDLNTTMTAEIYDNVAAYINSQNGYRHKLYCPSRFPTDGTIADGFGFIMSSSHIQIQERNGFDVLDENELSYLENYSISSDGTGSKIKSLLQKEEIEYYLVFNENSKNELENLGLETCLEGMENTDPYWLMKVE